MKHFIFGILALSAGLQNANAMEEHGLDNNCGIKIIKVLEIVPPFEEDIDKINVLKDQNKIEIELKTSEESIMQEVISIDIPNKQDIKIATMDYVQNQELFAPAVILKSMLQDEFSDILISCQPLITNIDNVGAGLREINLRNTGLVGKCSFAYNLPLSNVTIYTHNEGLVIDKFAFGNCGTINSFSINGDIKYVSDYAFAGTIINFITLDRKPSFDVYQSLIDNRNIKNICWKAEMSEEDDY